MNSSKLPFPSNDIFDDEIDLRPIKRCFPAFLGERYGKGLDTFAQSLFRPIPLFGSSDVLCGVCVPETAQVYRPLHPSPPYPDVLISRDNSFGPDPANVVDIFAPKKKGKGRPVLIYVSGGAGNRQQGGPNGDPFYDNVMLWAVKNGMVGVNMQRRPGQTWDDPAKDIAIALFWLSKNIGKFRGNPNRMFIWAHSAANGPLGIYSGHPELYGPQGIGVKGIIFMSGQFSILREDGTNPVPQAAPRDPSAPAPPAAGATCGGVTASDGALPGKAAGQPGGPNPAFAAGAGAGGRGGPAIPQDELIKRSSLPGLEKTDAKIFLASAELDPGIVKAQPSAFNQALHDELCKQDGPKAKDGKGHCPMLVVMKAESHMSAPYSVDSGDKTVSTPILAWIKSTK